MSVNEIEDAVLRLPPNSTHSGRGLPKSTPPPGTVKLKMTLRRGAWTRLRTKPWKICGPAAAQICEASRHSQVLGLLSAASRRYMPSGRRILPAAPARSAAPFSALQEARTLLVRSRWLALPGTRCGTRRRDSLVLGRNPCHVQSASRWQMSGGPLSGGKMRSAVYEVADNSNRNSGGATSGHSP